MTSIDCKDAYYSMPVWKEFRKFLCFQWQGQMYRFTCLASATRMFTKITKVLSSELRKLGHPNTTYIDNSLHFWLKVVFRNVSEM